MFGCLIKFLRLLKDIVLVLEKNFNETKETYQ